jgi:hypothetical protein
MDVEELHAFFEMPSTGAPRLSPDAIAIVGGASQASVASAPFQKDTGCCKLDIYPAIRSCPEDP